MSTRDDLEPPLLAVRAAVSIGLAEDLLPMGDLTATLIDRGAVAKAAFVAREDGVVAGISCITETCAQLDPALQVERILSDGSAIAPGGVIARVSGPFRSILIAERTALNFLCHLSGIATLTAAYVANAASTNPSVRIIDTRKTTPGLRALEKAAVRAGGGANHRGSLSEAVLVKDNHLGGLSITEAVSRAASRWPGRMIEVECDRIEQVMEALETQATVIMCDNMSPSQVAECALLVRAHPRGNAKAVLLEVSGGIKLDNVAEYAASGPDLISVGALTHSARALDIGLDLES